MKILHLTLKKEYFDQIYLGYKNIEYREVKPYWESRLDGKHFDEVHFRNGYSNSSPFMRVKCEGIAKSRGWYLIILGDVLEVKQ